MDVNTMEFLNLFGQTTVIQQQNSLKVGFGFLNGTWKMGYSAHAWWKQEGGTYQELFNIICQVN